jgi:CheY-like chemotaxis protein
LQIVSAERDTGAGAGTGPGRAGLEGLLDAMRAYHRGDPSARAPVTPGDRGAAAELCRLFNAIAERTNVLETELDLLARGEGDGRGNGSEARNGESGASGAADGERPPVFLVLESDPGNAAERAMTSAADSALRDLGAEPRVGVLRIDSPESVRAAAAGHRVVSALLDARAPLDRILTTVAGLDAAVPGVALLCFAPEGDAAALDRAVTATRGRNRAETVRSVGQAAERLTLHWLTEVPGAADRQAEPADPTYGQIGFDGEKVLVVDDDVRNVFAMVSALELYGLTALTADSGPEAIDLLERNPDVRVVLMDLMMPGIDGFTATAKIRAMAGYGQLPIVAVTARAAPGDRELSLQAGMDEHVTKPVEVERLLALIRRLIDSGRPAR